MVGWTDLRSANYYVHCTVTATQLGCISGALQPWSLSLSPTAQITSPAPFTLDFPKAIFAPITIVTISFQYSYNNTMFSVCYLTVHNNPHGHRRLFDMSTFRTYISNFLCSHFYGRLHMAKHNKI